ncbi:12144_t:CDS:1, partial [Cetraspora pellucida]
EFKGSNSWVNKFKKRHNLSEYKKTGEGASVPLEILPKERRKIQEIIINSNFQLENIFNIDETELF